MPPLRSAPRPLLACLRLCLAAGLSAGLAAGCSTSPATGETHLNALTEPEEIQIGEQEAPAFLEAFGGEIPSSQIRQYVRDLGEQLATLSERPHLPWEFFVVDSPILNAFALPGGKVFVSRGLLAEMTNEAQLAAVLGHEIGHVTDEHLGRQMTRAAAAEMGLGLLGVAAGADYETWVKVLGLGTNVYLLTFSRDQEHAADELGMRYMTQLGYHPDGAAQLMEILARASGSYPGFEFFATHPHPESRIDRIQAIIVDRYPDRDEPGRYSLHEPRFRETVLNELPTLPPPSHDPEQQQQDG
ncbi:MAG: M48 family metalloprotease [Phycisphaeraceae bacterium]